MSNKENDKLYDLIQDGEIPLYCEHCNLLITFKEYDYNDGLCSNCKMQQDARYDNEYN